MDPPRESLADLMSYPIIPFFVRRPLHGPPGSLGTATILERMTFETQAAPQKLVARSPPYARKLLHNYSLCQHRGLSLRGSDPIRVKV